MWSLCHRELIAKLNYDSYKRYSYISISIENLRVSYFGAIRECHPLTAPRLHDEVIFALLYGLENAEEKELVSLN